MSDTGTMIMLIMIYVACFALIFYNFGTFAATVLRWSKPPIKNKNKKLTQPKLEGSELIKCYIPIYQVSVVREALYRTGGPFPVLSIVSLVGITVNLINKFLLPISSYVMFVCSIIMIVCLFVTIIIYAFVTVDCARMYSFSFTTLLLCAIAPCIFCYYIKTRIPAKMMEIHKEETFDEHHGDTVVKQRYNK